MEVGDSAPQHLHKATLCMRGSHRRPGLLISIYTGPQMDEGYMRACMCVWRRCVCVRESIHPRGVSVISRGQKERAKDKVSARQRWMERGGEKESEEGERHREK